VREQGWKQPERRAGIKDQRSRRRGSLSGQRLDSNDRRDSVPRHTVLRQRRDDALQQGNASETASGVRVLSMHDFADRRRHIRRGQRSGQT